MIITDKQKLHAFAGHLRSSVFIVEEYFFVRQIAAPVAGAVEDGPDRRVSCHGEPDPVGPAGLHRERRAKRQDGGAILRRRLAGRRNTYLRASACICGWNKKPGQFLRVLRGNLSRLSRRRLYYPGTGYGGLRASFVVEKGSIGIWGFRAVYHGSARTVRRGRIRLSCASCTSTS